MKLLNITEEIEKSIVALFDMALKAGGTSILSHIDAIRQAVQVKMEDELPKDKEEVPNSAE